MQISDSHIGFNKDANPDVNGTLARTVAVINGMQEQPAFIMHTGDITHLSKPEEFDTAAQLLSALNVGELHTVPGEHDVIDATGNGYMTRYGAPSGGKGYYSFDSGGVHFVALVNVLNFKAGGLGTLGADQLAWLQDDLRGTQFEHADRGVRPYAALVDLSQMGLGHVGRRSGDELSTPLRIGERAQRPYPSDRAEGGRQYRLPYRALDRLSATGGGHGRRPRSAKGSRRSARHDDRPDQHKLGSSQPHDRAE